MDSTITESEPQVRWISFLLQTSDALFPTGAYAHSLGFEEAVRLGLASDEKTLHAFLVRHVLPTLESFELPYLRFAREAALDADFSVLAELDAEVGATKLARETREGSVQLGVRRLKGLRIILQDNRCLAALERAVHDGELAGHHVLVCGVQSAVANVPLEAAMSAYAYQSLAAVASAALKLIRIGQDGVQRALSAACAGIPVAVARSLVVTRDDAGWFNPLLEIASMRHEQAAERLFIS